MGKQPLFLVDSPGVAGHLPLCAQTAVTGDQDGDRILPHSLPHRLGGHLFSQLPGDSAVGGGFPVGNGQQELPDPVLEGRVPAIEEDEAPSRLLCTEYPEAKA